MTDIPVLDRLGADLEAALRARPRPRWWRARPALATGLALVALAVPAAGTQVHWAALVHGETALPTQARGVRAVLARGDVHEATAWQLVAYNARLAGQPEGKRSLGLCTFVTDYAGGVGRCVARDARSPLTLASDGSANAVIAGVVSPAVARVELTLVDGRRLAVAPQAPDPAVLRKAGLQGSLRFFTVVAGGARVAGAIARSGDGGELARTARPRPLPASAPVLSSPVTLEAPHG